MATSGAHLKDQLEAEFEKFEAFPREKIEIYLSVLRAENRQERMDALPDDQQIAALQCEALIRNIDRLVQERVRRSHLVKAPSEPHFSPALIFAPPSSSASSASSADSESADEPRIDHRILVRRNTQ